MDVNMPVLDGIAATRAIIAEHPETKILMLTSFGETDTLLRYQGRCSRVLTKEPWKHRHYCGPLRVRKR